MQKRKNIPKCKVTDKGIICCEHKHINKIIKKKYRAPPKYLHIVENDFIKNIIRPEIHKDLKKGNTIDKIKAWAIETPVNCGNRFEFRNEGDERVVDEVSFCICREENWEKVVEELKNKIPLKP